MGAGRVAHHLAHALQPHHQIVQIYSQGFANAQILAAEVGAQAIQQLDQLDTQIDLCVIAVSDHTIRKVIHQLEVYLKDTLIVHTSGSTDLNMLSEHHARAGVFYPLQTFSKQREIDWSATPLFVEAANPADLERLINLANSLSSRVYPYSSAQRLSLHLAAVFACNFSNYCYDMAKQVVDAKQVDFSLLYPLILETAQKATQNEPRQMQTGPAMRGDENILNMHQQMLAQDQNKDLQHVYSLMSQQILQRHQNDEK